MQTILSKKLNWITLDYFHKAVNIVDINKDNMSIYYSCEVDIMALNRSFQNDFTKDLKDKRSIDTLPIRINLNCCFVSALSAKNP